MNEDRVLDRPEAGIWAVADGMGGHQAGDVAATRLVEALDRVRHGASGYAWLADVTRQVQAVNAQLFDGAQSLGGAVCGSTLVTLLIHDGHYACLWAGDSRAYRLRDAVLTPISRDHSVVQQLVDGGGLAESERRNHPSAHVITRAIGAKAHLELDQQFAPILHGDTFLLSSDGLTACIDDEEIATALRQPDLDVAADGLMGAALNREANDNISLVLVRVRAASEKAMPAKAQVDHS